jgi:hypothetical protein
MDTIGAMSEGAAPPKDVPEAATNADLAAQCLDQSGLCVLALLDADDAAHEANLGVMKLVAGKWAKQPLRFSWVNAARQVGHAGTIHVVMSLNFMPKDINWCACQTDKPDL